MANLSSSMPVEQLTGSEIDGDQNNNKSAGRWTQDEHKLFLEGLEKYQKQWKLIADLVKTRTVVQIRTHAQKYFQKLNKKNGGKDGSNLLSVSLDDADFGSGARSIPSFPSVGSRANSITSADGAVTSTEGDSDAERQQLQQQLLGGGGRRLTATTSSPHLTGRGAGTSYIPVGTSSLAGLTAASSSSMFNINMPTASSANSSGGGVALPTRLSLSIPNPHQHSSSSEVHSAGASPVPQLAHNQAYKGKAQGSSGSFDNTNVTGSGGGAPRKRSREPKSSGAAAGVNGGTDPALGLGLVADYGATTAAQRALAGSRSPHKKCNTNPNSPLTSPSKPTGGRKATAVKAKGGSAQNQQQQQPQPQFMQTMVGPAAGFGVNSSTGGRGIAISAGAGNLGHLSPRLDDPLCLIDGHGQGHTDDLLFPSIDEEGCYGGGIGLGLGLGLDDTPDLMMPGGGLLIGDDDAAAAAATLNTEDADELDQLLQKIDWWQHHGHQHPQHFQQQQQQQQQQFQQHVGVGTTSEHGLTSELSAPTIGAISTAGAGATASNSYSHSNYSSNSVGACKDLPSAITHTVTSSRSVSPCTDPGSTHSSSCASSAHDMHQLSAMHGNSSSAAASLPSSVATGGTAAVGIAAMKCTHSIKATKSGSFSSTGGSKDGNYTSKESSTSDGYVHADQTASDAKSSSLSAAAAADSSPAMSTDEKEKERKRKGDKPEGKGNEDVDAAASTGDVQQTRSAFSSVIAELNFMTRVAVARCGADDSDHISLFSLFERPTPAATTGDRSSSSSSNSNAAAAAVSGGGGGSTGEGSGPGSGPSVLPGRLPSMRTLKRTLAESQLQQRQRSNSFSFNAALHFSAVAEAAATAARSRMDSICSQASLDAEFSKFMLEDCGFATLRDSVSSTGSAAKRGGNPHGTDLMHDARARSLSAGSKSRTCSDEGFSIGAGPAAGLQFGTGGADRAVSSTGGDDEGDGGDGQSDSPQRRSLSAGVSNEPLLMQNLGQLSALHPMMGMPESSESLSAVKHDGAGGAGSGAGQTPQRKRGRPRKNSFDAALSAVSAAPPPSMQAIVEAPPQQQQQQQQQDQQQDQLEQHQFHEVQFSYEYGHNEHMHDVNEDGENSGAMMIHDPFDSFDSGMLEVFE